MTKTIVGLLVAIMLPAAGLAADPPLSPEETVRRYLTAVQAQDFETAWDYISKAMKQGRSKEVWVKETQYVTHLAEVKIFDFKVYRGKVEGGAAKVPNILSSQDKFLNQLGVDEHEIYRLVKEDGKWKIDHQEIVIGETEKKEWFSNDPLD